MTVRDIILLGDERLYQHSEVVSQNEVASLLPAIRDMHDTMQAFKEQHGWGRAISAPQINVRQRIVCMNVDREYTFINPILDNHSEATTEYWEDCMSFPELIVRIKVPKTCRMTYRDVHWKEHVVTLEGFYSELLQHEVDHLHGVLAVQRALDDRSIALRETHATKDLSIDDFFVPRPL